MKKINVLFQAALGCLAITFMVSCQGERHSDGVTGSVINSSEVLVSQVLPDQIKPLDTVEIVDGEFYFATPFEGPEFILFEFNSKLRVPLLIRPNERITLSVTDTGDMGTFEASGTLSAERLTKQNKLFVETLHFIDSLDQLAGLYQDSANFMEQRPIWNAAFVERLEMHRTVLFDMFREDSTEMANIMAFYQGKGGFELMRFPQDERYFKMVDNGLRSVNPDDKHVQFFHESYEMAMHSMNRQKRMEEAALNITAGKTAPEIELPGFDGTSRKLSDLRGKVVLIDFWASWCGPCRRANPELVQIYNTYKDKGFDVFSVSIDGLKQQNNPELEWQNAIAKDGLVWENHVSDLKGYESEVIDEYGFSGIPFTVLIDGNGVIVAKNIRGDQLIQKLESLL